MEVRIDGKLIARSELGKRWNDGIECFFEGMRASYGRTILRKSAIEITILRNRIRSCMVLGNDVVATEIDFQPISEANMGVIREKMGDSAITGFVDSSLSSMLIPQKCETKSTCDRCGEGFCEHVAATLYGFSSVIDIDPNLILTLRCIDADAFISKIVRDRYSEMVSKANVHSARIIPDDVAERLFRF